MSGSNGILIVLTATSGELDPPALALAGEAVDWAGTFVPPLPVEALVFGKLENVGETLGPYGVLRVHQCLLSETDFIPEAAAYNASLLAGQTGAGWIFCLASTAADFSFASLAGWLQAGLVTRCVDLEHVASGEIKARHPLHEGRLHQEVFLDPEMIQVLAWEPVALGRCEPGKGPAAEVTAVTPAASPLARRVRPVKRIKGDYRTLPLSEAGRIVAMGRGIMAEGFSQVTRTAEFLEASVGATRPVIDAGLLPFERQIGQTGVQVSPQLLLACGISGANEFTVGITNSRTVVAINTDPRARIFSMADLGIVGDAGKVLDALLAISSRASDTGEAPEEKEARS